jgi:hypothetical protein
MMSCHVTERDLNFFFACLLACYLSTTGSVAEKDLGLKISGGSFWKWHIAREWGGGSCKAQRGCVL